MNVCGKLALFAYSKPPGGGFALFDYGYSGVEVIDVGDSASPKRLLSFSTPGLAQAAIVLGSTIVIAGGIAGLLVRG